ncbi:hypothetical protein EsH8_V_001045 [Colletotrichum jinshuiense]
MPYSLKDRCVLVTGGSRGLGAVICRKFAEHGAHVMVNYVSNKKRAQQVVEEVDAFGVKAALVQGDAGVPEDNSRIVAETVEKLGGLDIIVANAGWTLFSDFKDLNALSIEEWNKCWATNTLCHLQLMQAAGPIFNANAEGGVYLISSSIAGLQFTEEQIAQEQNESVLKHETFLDDCADAYISAAQNTSMTGQEIAVDAGLTISWQSRF